MEEVFREFKPNAKESTIKAYVASLSKLKRMLGDNDYEPDLVFPLLEKLHYTSRRNILNSVIVYLQAIGKPTDEIVPFLTKRDEYNKRYANEQLSGKISEKQQPNFVSLDDLKEMVKRIEVDVRQIKKDAKTKPITASQKNLLSAYTLFVSYMSMPLRNDLASMKIITKRGFNKIPSEEKSKNNYLLMGKNQLSFVLNNYKTAGKYGEKILPLPKPVERKMRSYMKLMDLPRTNDILFDFNSNSMTQLLIRTSEKYIKKRIGTTMLRKIYLSDKFSDTKKEKEKDANIMGHSKEMGELVYTKDKADMVGIDDTVPPPKVKVEVNPIQ